MGRIKIAAAVVLVVGAGLVHGAWTDRWGPSAELAALAARFETVPMVIGDWKGTPQEVPLAERAMAGATACLSRTYVNPNGGGPISVLLLGGLPGKISTHPPEACYAGSGFDLGTPARYRFSYGPGPKQAQFKTAVAHRGGTRPSALRIYWAWNAGDLWKAPDEPRWEFGPATSLCKLYVVRETSGIAAAPDQDPANDFLAVLLPELEKCVFAASK
jgi:hypothetical protein